MSQYMSTGELRASQKLDLPLDSLLLKPAKDVEMRLSMIPLSYLIVQISAIINFVAFGGTIILLMSSSIAHTCELAPCSHNHNFSIILEVFRKVIGSVGHFK